MVATAAMSHTSSPGLDGLSSSTSRARGSGGNGPAVGTVSTATAIAFNVAAANVRTV